MRRQWHPHHPLVGALREALTQGDIPTHEIGVPPDIDLRQLAAHVDLSLSTSAAVKRYLCSRSEYVWRRRDATAAPL